MPDIATRCPTCGRQTLFLTRAGHVICSWIGCAQPSVAIAFEKLSRRLESSSADYVAKCQLLVKEEERAAGLEEKLTAATRERNDLIARLTEWAKLNDREREELRHVPSFLNPHTVLDWMKVPAEERQALGCHSQAQLDAALAGRLNSTNDGSQR